MSCKGFRNLVFVASFQLRLYQCAFSALLTARPRRAISNSSREHRVLRLLHKTAADMLDRYRNQRSRQNFQRMDRCSNSVESSQRRERVSRKKLRGCDKGRKAAAHCLFRFFPMVSCAGGLKSRLGKAAGAEPFGGMRDQKLNAVAAHIKDRCQNAKSTPA